MENKKKNYLYSFDNGESHNMTPEEAHRYSHKRKLKILKGPNYSNGRQRIAFNGFGWHDSLKMNFRGPKHYRAHLKEKGLEEWGNEQPPLNDNGRGNYWTDETIRKAVQNGFEIDGELAKAMLSGEV